MNEERVLLDLRDPHITPQLNMAFVLRAKLKIAMWSGWVLAIQPTEDRPTTVVVEHINRGEQIILGQDDHEPVTHDFQQRSHPTTVESTTGKPGHLRTTDPTAEESTWKGAPRRPLGSCVAPIFPGDAASNVAAAGELIIDGGKEGGADAGAGGGMSEEPSAQASKVCTRTPNISMIRIPLIRLGDGSIQVGGQQNICWSIIL